MADKSTTKLFNLHLKDQLKRSTTLPTLLFILLIVGYLFSIDKGYLPSPNIFTKTVKVKVEVEKDKEIIKYVEQYSMKSSEFVTHINPRIDPVIAEEIGKAVDKYSKEYQLPRKLVLAIIKKESFFNPFAKSSVAFGLMQVYPKYHKDKIKKIGITDQREIYHIDNNINIGCQIFREYFDASDGDLDETFHKYLSKKATKQQRDAYKNAILTAWARMEFLEYSRKNQKQLEIEDKETEERDQSNEINNMPMVQ